MRKKVKRPFSGGYRGPERVFTGIKSYICRKEKTDWKYGKRGFEWMVVGGDRALVGRGLVWASLSRRVARGGVALRRGVGRDYRLVPDDPVSRLFRAGEDQPRECPFSCWRACRHVAAFTDRADLCRPLFLGTGRRDRRCSLACPFGGAGGESRRRSMVIPRPQTCGR